MRPLLFPDDPSFEFEVLRTLGHAAYGGADVGEVLTTAQRIRAGDYDSWHEQSLATADRVAAEAETALQGGHRITARDGLLRANNYYRAAEFFLHGDPDDPRIEHAYARSTQCFTTAATLFDPPIEPVRIPYESTVLHGWFYRAAGAGTGPDRGEDAVRPTMVMHNGFDGTAEEMHHNGAAAGVQRGYHVLTFDGPGQPAARHLGGLLFRPDWESVVTPVLDWLLKRPRGRPGPDRAAGPLHGRAAGPGAAALDHRIAACVAVDGVYDLGATVTAAMPGTRLEAEKLLRAQSAPEVDAMIAQLMASDSSVRWAAAHGQYVMGADSPRAFFASYLDYTLAGGIAEQITGPTLVADAQEDHFFAGQPRQLFDHLTCPKTFLPFTSAEGAGAHCHAGAQRLASGRIYDWLDDVLAAPQPAAA